MRVSSGWNTDYGKVKFDLSLDEDDLRRILEEHGLPADLPVTVNEAFGILNNEAQSYSKFQLCRVVPEQEAQLKTEIARHRQARDFLLEKIANERRSEVR